MGGFSRLVVVREDYMMRDAMLLHNATLCFRIHLTSVLEWARQKGH